MRLSASPPTSNPPEPEGARGPRPASRRPGLYGGAAMLLVPACWLEQPASEVLNALWGHDQMSPSLWTRRSAPPSQDGAQYRLLSRTGALLVAQLLGRRHHGGVGTWCSRFKRGRSCRSESGMEGAELNLDHANANLEIGDALPKRSPRRGSSVRQIRWPSHAGRHRDRGVTLSGTTEAVAEAPRGRRGRGLTVFVRVREADVADPVERDGVVLGVGRVGVVGGFDHWVLLVTGWVGW